MPRNRFDELPPEKQEAILAAAADEFAERGFGGASLNRIIERAGTSKGALYYYFDDKADLFATVVERAVARLLAGVEWPGLDEFTAENFWDRVLTLSRRSLAQMKLETWYVRIALAYHRLREEPAARVATDRVVDHYREITRAFTQRGRELGVVRTDLPLEILVEMIMAADEAGDRWMVRHWNEMTESERMKLIEARTDMMRDMLDAKRMGWEQ